MWCFSEEVMSHPFCGSDQSSLQGVAQVMNLDLYSSSPLSYWGVNFTYVLILGYEPKLIFSFS